MATKILTAERLREVVSFDPATGVFTQNHRRRGSGKPAGAVAGWRMKIGYTAMCVDGKQHFAHRLAFLWMTGAWPAHDVDHINGDKADNRWDNLRDVRKDTNLQNMRKPTKFNTAGLLGASWDKLCGKWRAQIRVKGRTTYIGSYKTAKEAHEAYVAKKRIHHPGCTI